MHSLPAALQDESVGNECVTEQRSHSITTDVAGRAILKASGMGISCRESS
jgi:hypothetical protein